jgi:hypothetical protein
MIDEDPCAESAAAAVAAAMAAATADDQNLEKDRSEQIKNQKTGGQTNNRETAIKESDRRIKSKKNQELGRSIDSVAWW